MRPRVWLVLALASAACGAPWGPGVEPVAVGDAAPAAWSAHAAETPGALLVVWALRGADVVTCATAAREIRHVQRAYGPAVRAMAVTSGRDSALVGSFFRAERLAGLPRRHLEERQFRAETGGETAPTVYVVRDGAVVARLRADRQTLLSGRGADRAAERLRAHHLPADHGRAGRGGAGSAVPAAQPYPAGRGQPARRCRADGHRAARRRRRAAEPAAGHAVAPPPSPGINSQRRPRGAHRASGAGAEFISIQHATTSEAAPPLLLAAPT